MVNLSEYMETIKKADCLRLEIQRHNNSATKTTAVLDGVPRARGNRSKVEENAVIAADLEIKRAELLERLEQMKAELSEMFCALALTDPHGCAVMRLRYLYGYKPKQIAAGIGETERNVYRYMKEATAALLRLFPGRFLDK